ncbi:MAG: 16S rRNA (adenine(1518)-N(6)/adenine(1519)-N(6))-dimethyltransferase RsmA [Candidatus Saccharicenans sp.]
MARKTRRQLLGQHFLHEEKIQQKIIEAVEPQPDDLIFEIGPGRGALTYPLAERAGKVLAIEKDYSLVQALENNKPENLEIIAGDILRVDLKSLIVNHRGRAKRVKLVGNLPYHISSQILFVLLEVKEMIDRAVFLFQKEVAERIISGPGSKKYSPLSILLQNFFDCRLLFHLKPGAFSPPPKVDSAGLLFLHRNIPLYFSLQEQENFSQFLKNCFNQRRKTLTRNLESSGYQKEQIIKFIAQLGLKAQVRAEELSPEQLYQLYKFIKNAKEKNSPGQ